MKFELTEVFNFGGALRGMRNPMRSWQKSDSDSCAYMFVMGQNDLDLARRLIRAGTEHRKFTRQIMVSVDITAPLYWWKEFDTYKIGTTANSTSTMHQLHKFPITHECFEIDKRVVASLEGWTAESEVCEAACIWTSLIRNLESLRLKYVETNDTFYWTQLVQLLPSSWLQTRTVTMNYENVYNMYAQRHRHKLPEWRVDFCEWARALPYFKEMYESNIDLSQ